MPLTEKEREYRKKYDEKNMVSYTLKYQKNIYECVEKAMKKTGLNRNRWTTLAIIEKLERDGFLISENEEKKITRGSQAINV